MLRREYNIETNTIDNEDSEDGSDDDDDNANQGSFQIGLFQTVLQIRGRQTVRNKRRIHRLAYDILLTWLPDGIAHPDGRGGGGLPKGTQVGRVGTTDEVVAGNHQSDID